MTERSAQHAKFVVERMYPAAPAKVFAAWAVPALKSRWFADPSGEYSLDFRVGGREVNRSAGAKPDAVFDARYHDIVADERIIYSYDLYLHGALVSVSLATVQLSASASGTLLVFTEQAVFLEGLDTPAAREQGTAGLLEKLGAVL